jgi:hypothetical protein
MPRPGIRVTLVNSGFVVLTGVRRRVTTFCPPISVADASAPCSEAAWTRPVKANEPANSGGKAKGRKASARTMCSISIHP